MSAPQVSTEPSLFDHSSREPARKPIAPSPTAPSTDERAASPAAATEVAEPGAASSHSDVAELETAEDTHAIPAAEVALSPEAIAQNERKRLAEQLDALKRKEFELRRALAAADHPEVADAIRAIEARAFAVSRAEGKVAQGFSKTEARRREVIEKKLAVQRAKRAELDGQIGELETELSGLGADRLAAFESERLEALEQLMIVMATHDAGLRAAKLDLSGLVPDIERWLPELEAIAKKASGGGSTPF
jgi:hypothetical protein